MDNYSENSKNPWSGLYSGAPKGMRAGGKWKNEHNQLPIKTKDGTKITYQEFDINPQVDDRGIEKVYDRGIERFVVGKDTNGKVVSVYYTDSHYGQGKSKNGLPDFIEIINY